MCRWPRPGAPLVLAAPDAFKGTAPAAEVAAAVTAAAGDAGWKCDECPLSDGGEGFAEVVAGAELADGGDPGRWIETTVTGPLGRPWWPGGTSGPPWP